MDEFEPKPDARAVADIPARGEPDILARVVWIREAVELRQWDEALRALESLEEDLAAQSEAA